MNGSIAKLPACYEEKNKHQLSRNENSSSAQCLSWPLTTGCLCLKNANDILYIFEWVVEIKFLCTKDKIDKGLHESKEHFSPSKNKSTSSRTECFFFNFRFLRSNKLEKLEFKLEKKYQDLETCRKS